MANNGVEYKCPKCTGPLHYSAAEQKMQCEYCQSVFEVAEVEAMYQNEIQQAQAGESTSSGWNQNVTTEEWTEDNVNSYNCKSCGAQVISETNELSINCPYCNNPTVLLGKFRGTVKPDYIIGFKLDKAQAVAKLKEHYKGKFFLPKAFSSENHVNEIKGMYVPYWLFSGEVEGSITYKADKTYTKEEGDYKVKTVEHYKIHREGKFKFNKLPMDASSKLDDTYMESVEPFNYADMVPFSSSFLPGFMADIYDVSVEDTAGRIAERLINSMKENLRKTVNGYENVRIDSDAINIRKDTVNYAFLPVWILNTKWNDKNYTFMMNGQTGKFIGDLPVDKAKFWMTFASIFVGLSIIIMLVITFSGSANAAERVNVKYDNEIVTEYYSDTVLSDIII